MANDKDFVVNGPVAVGKDTKVTVGSIGSTQEGYYIAGASYDSVSFNINSQDTSPKSVFFKPDGTKMFVVGGAGTDVNEYNLSTDWNVSTATFSQNTSVSSQENNPEGVFFKPDGTKMYITGGAGDEVNEYNLSTAWDISTLSYSQNFSVSTQDADPKGVFFKPDGSKMYIVGAGGGVGNLYEYNLSTAWNISTASYSQTFSISTQETSPEGMYLKSDGTKAFVVGDANDKVYEYTLSTAWDISTASFTKDFSVNAQEEGPKGIFFKPDGVKMYIIGSGSDSVHQYSTVRTVSPVDLSTGNYFTDSPSGDYTYTFANPGDVQSFQIEATGGSAAVASTFSTDIYDGTGAYPSGGTDQKITNSINLSGDGGLVWVKARSTDTRHALFDTERGVTKMQNSAETAADTTVDSRTFVSFDTDGFTLGDESQGWGRTNTTGQNYVSWSFKKQTKFFDIVTYTGTGVAGRTVSHSLGADVGTLIVKKTNSTDNWFVWHRGLTDATYRIMLNSTSAETQQTNAWNSTAPSSTEFTLGDNGNTNASGDTYVAYIFAHDTASDGLIQCGSYTGNGSNTGPVINLGWQPQWLMVKPASSSGDWWIVDSVRGVVDGGNDPRLLPSASDAEASSNYVKFTSTGFQPEANFGIVNSSGISYIYMAIRSAAAPAITWPTNIEWTAGSTPSTPAEGETDVYTFTTDDGGTTYTGIQSIDNAS